MKKKLLLMARLVLFVGALIVATHSSAFSAELQKDKPAKRATLATANGRYVFGQVSDFGKDQYLLDTQTGRLWQMVTTTDKKDENGNALELKLNPIPYIQILGKHAYIPDSPKEVEEFGAFIRGLRAREFEEAVRRDEEDAADWAAKNLPVRPAEKKGAGRK